MVSDRGSEQAERTKADQIVEVERELYQIRLNRAATKEALEDALARDEDVKPHEKAIAGHDSKIARLESRLRGLERARILEKRTN